MLPDIAFRRKRQVRTANQTPFPYQQLFVLGKPFYFSMKYVKTLRTLEPRCQDEARSYVSQYSGLVLWTDDVIVPALCRICEPIAFMSIFPYIFFMIRSFHITENEDQIGFYAGLVTSAFAFAEFSTGVFWGRLSDRIGRKPVLMAGLIGTLLSMLVFGFAPSLPIALLGRALGGALNGYVPCT